MWKLSNFQILATGGGKNPRYLDAYHFTEAVSISRYRVQLKIQKFRGKLQYPKISEFLFHTLPEFVTFTGIFWPKIAISPTKIPKNCNITRMWKVVIFPNHRNVLFFCKSPEFKSWSFAISPESFLGKVPISPESRM